MPPYIPAVFFLSGDASEVYCLNLPRHRDKTSREFLTTKMMKTVWKLDVMLKSLFVLI